MTEVIVGMPELLIELRAIVQALQDLNNLVADMNVNLENIEYELQEKRVKGT